MPVNRNYVLSKYVLNENDCMAWSRWKVMSKATSMHIKALLATDLDCSMLVQDFQRLRKSHGKSFSFTSPV